MMTYDELEACYVNPAFDKDLSVLIKARIAAVNKELEDIGKQIAYSIEHTQRVIEWEYAEKNDNSPVPQFNADIFNYRDVELSYPAWCTDRINKDIATQRALRMELENLKALLAKQNAPDPAVSLPLNSILEKLTEGTSPVLRKWIGGKYKCQSFEKFIKAYGGQADNLDPSLIRDYLVSARTGEPYSKKTIEQRLKEHRI